MSTDLSDYVAASGALSVEDFLEEHGDLQVIPKANDLTSSPINSTSVSGDDSKLLPDARFPQHIVYDSYSGADTQIDLVLPDEEPISMGEIQTFSYSMHRKQLPVRTVGHVNPIAFGRSGRTLAGSMIFTVFNYYAFYRLQHMRNAINKGLFGVADMLPPFDINITFINEYGSFSKMRMYGVSFVDEGGVMSIDDMITESTMSYVARGIQPMTARGLLDDE